MMSLSGRRIVLVGGAGFIGHHLALKLSQLGADVFVIDSLATARHYSLKKHHRGLRAASFYLRVVKQRLDLLRKSNVPLIELEPRDYHQLSQAVAGVKPDTLIHLAAVSHLGKSYKDPNSTFDHTLRTLENSLDVARSPALRIQHFVFFSSGMVYGDAAAPSTPEDSPCEPLGIEGALKFAGEKIVLAYNQVFDLPYTIIRPSALYGPRSMSRRIGQIYIEDLSGASKISICGNDSDRLDFTYIEDLVTGVLNTLRSGKSKNQIFNLAYGEGRSVAEMKAILTEYFPGVIFEQVPRDRLMPYRTVLSIDKARRLLGYKPNYPLERGLEEHLQWCKEFLSENGDQKTPGASLQRTSLHRK